MSSQSISFSELLCLLDSKLVDQTLNPELANWIGRPVIPWQDSQKNFCPTWCLGPGYPFVGYTASTWMPLSPSLICSSLNHLSREGLAFGLKCWSSGTKKFSLHEITFGRDTKLRIAHRALYHLSTGLNISAIQSRLDHWPYLEGLLKEKKSFLVNSIV